MYAYFVFPTAVERLLNNVDAGPFAPHVTRTANFVRFCAHSHWIMALRDLFMLGFMYAFSEDLYFLYVGVLFVTLIPLWYGAQYSTRAAKFLRRDANAINRFIGTAEQLSIEREREQRGK